MKNSIKKALKLGTYGLVLLCAACQQDATKSPVIENTGAADSSPGVSESANQTAPTGSSLSQQVAGAVADLADRTGVAEAAIVVRNARLVNWGSGAVGCPEKDKSYTQMVVPGVLVFLQADGKFYRYHGRTQGSLFYCPKERAIAPAYGPGKEFM